MNVAATLIFVYCALRVLMPPPVDEADNNARSGAAFMAAVAAAVYVGWIA